MAIIVKAGPQDTNDQVIRKFKKKIQMDEILTKIKEKEFYKKPSLLRKEKKQELKRKYRRQNRDQ
ncbi:30S ribosomal protein S21 [Candidatus Beckwithbacteria bacterium RBG_13_42_9]|uniref:Small ribosomal subunit protein bS21 n=1 Tax=Candidatus Beckwithbacteria bacterium RBG_13_42_9 TaxID=1797457 RepID=A0A1F5E652_9BACT|nr:MAG: 30S ribosomal protein S21 [Candidatus Beckwithbacteria bacterium RBG_13_42_9]